MNLEPNFMYINAILLGWVHPTDLWTLLKFSTTRPAPPCKLPNLSKINKVNWGITKLFTWKYGITWRDCGVIWDLLALPTRLQSRQGSSIYFYNPVIATMCSWNDSRPYTRFIDIKYAIMGRVLNDIYARPSCHKIFYFSIYIKVTVQLFFFYNSKIERNKK